MTSRKVRAYVRSKALFKNSFWNVHSSFNPDKVNNGLTPLLNQVGNFPKAIPYSWFEWLAAKIH